jgi:lysophospholipase L1-like esterase
LCVVPNVVRVRVAVGTLLVAGVACATPRTGGMSGAAAPRWVGTWACAPQLTEPGNNPPSPGLGGNTLRQIVYTSIGGQRLRVRLSNEFGDGPVTMRAVHVAASTGGEAIDAGTDRALAFSGTAPVTIPAGRSVWSDPFDFALAPQTRLAVTISFGAVPAGITGHPGSRTTSYLVPGDAVSAARLAGAATTDHWYYIAGIDVMADAAAAAVVTLGDSLTDGRGSTTNGNDRWPDNLSRRLRANAPTTKVAVLNQGIGGNAVTSGGLGPAAVQRFTRDVLGQSGVRWLIVFEGVNDICGPSGPQAAHNLIAAYGQLIDGAHAQGIRVYGAPLTPIAGSHYDSPDHEAARQAVNTWIRTSGRFDAVVDLDAAVRDPANPAHLLAAYDTGDHLHLNAAGYHKLADTIDVALFVP